MRELPSPPSMGPASAPVAQTDWLRGRRGGAGVVAAAAEDAAALPLRGSAPDPVVDPVGQGVFEARLLDRAVGADLAGLLDADAVGGEEVGGRGRGTWPRASTDAPGRRPEVRSEGRNP